MLPPEEPVFDPVQEPPRVPLASVTPEGNESTKLAPRVAVLAFVLLRVKVKRLVPLGVIVAGLNDFEMLGGKSTSKAPIAGLALTPAEVWSAPMLIVLV